MIAVGVARAKAGEGWQQSGSVFTTRTGRQVEPRNVYRSFTRVAESAGLRIIRLHDARHGRATLLTAAGVAPRVVMEILGHSQISITMDGTRWRASAASENLCPGGGGWTSALDTG